MSPDATRREVLAGVAAACGATLSPSTESRAATPGRRPERGSDRTDDVAGVVRRTLQREVRDHDADGATVAVVADGETVLTEGLGHAYRNPDDQVDPGSTPFRIGSVSKAFTFAAALRLVDEGRLDPHAPVGEALTSVEVPDADAYDDSVTLAHLATHTAGFEERSGGQFRRAPDELRSLPGALRANDPERIHPPGELPMYTNYNAGLAGQVVADALETEFADAVRRLVFDPLGMTASTFDPLPDALVGGRTDAAEDVTWYSEMTPASGMSATATDVARFIRAVVGDGSVDGARLLSPEAVDALHRQWYTPHDRLAGAAFGMERQRRDGTLVAGHHGGVPDFQTDLRLVPEEGVGLFVSVHGGEAHEVQQAVTAAFLDVVAPTAEPDPPDAAPTRGEALRGTYRSALVTDAASFEKPLLLQKPALTVRVAGSAELVTERRGTTHRWVEVAPLVFRRTDGEDTLVVREADDGTFRLFRATRPRTTYESVPWYGRSGLHGTLATGAGLAAISGVVGWPLAAGWRHLRGGSSPPAALSRGRWAAGAAALAFVAFIAVGVVGISRYWLYSRPPRFGLVFGLPVAGAALSVGAAGLVARAWRRGRGTLAARVHAGAVVAGLLVLSALLWYWNLLGLPL